MHIAANVPVSQLLRDGDVDRGGEDSEEPASNRWNLVTGREDNKRPKKQPKRTRVTK